MSVKEKIIEKVKHIPPLSESAEKLIAMMNDPDHNIASILKIINTDAALTARVLTVVNSAALALSEPITSISRAVSYLGDKKILDIALEFCINDLLQKPLEGYEGKQGALWQHNLCTAIASKEIARFTRTETCPDLAYTGGILHDMGKSVLSDFLRGTAAACTADIDTGNASDYLAAEEKRLATNHCHVGSAMARVWGLPDPIPDIIKYHHHPENADTGIRGLVYAVHLGDILAMNLASDSGSDALNYRLDSKYTEYIDITPDNILNIMLKVGDEYAYTKSLLLKEKDTAP